MEDEASVRKRSDASCLVGGGYPSGRMLRFGWSLGNPWREQESCRVKAIALARVMEDVTLRKEGCNFQELTEAGREVGRPVQLTWWRAPLLRAAAREESCTMYTCGQPR